MIGARIEFDLVLVARTALHIGSGMAVEEAVLDSSDQDVDANVPEVAAVMRDRQYRPYIPGSSLKGCLRSHLPDACALFGDKIAEGSRSQHRAGRMIFSDAFLEPQEEAGTRRSTRVAIDPETGVALKSRLFTREIVEPGARFALRLVCVDSPEKELVTDLATLLAVLLAADGIALGKGTRQSMGRIAAETNSFHARRIVPGQRSPDDVTNEWREAVGKASAPDVKGEQVALLLTTKSPFMISDPENAPSKGDKSTPQIVGLSEPGGGPELTGATLLGALRAQSAWLEAIEFPGRWDDKDFVLAKDDDPADLTSTQRLFGVTGWRGQLSVDRIRLRNTPKKQRVTSVRIDRFSAVPIDNALYTVEAWLAPEYEIALRFHPRLAATAADDRAFFDRLITELEDDIWGGLELGLGKTRGFGAFAVRRLGGLAND